MSKRLLERFIPAVRYDGINTNKTATLAAATGTVAGGNSNPLQFGDPLTPSLGVYFGSGAPTITAPQGSLYLRTDGSSVSTRLYVNTNGSTTWTAATTAA
jgi:hypothetical protein